MRSSRRWRGIVWAWPPPAAARLLRRQRGLPLPRPGLRGAAVRPRRRARRRLAADRLRRAGLRRSGAGPGALWRSTGRQALLLAVGRRPGGDELLLLPRHRPPPARHRRGDRVPARRSCSPRSARARRATPPRSRSPSPASTCSPACASPASRSASRSRSPTPRCSRSTSCSPHRVAQRPAIGGIDGLGARRCSIAAVVVTPLAGWAVVPALSDPVALAAGHRRRHLARASSPTSPTSSPCASCRARPTR